MLSILLLSPEGEGYGLACRVASEGHVAKFWSSAPYEVLSHSTRRPKQVDTFQPHVEAADVVVICGPGLGGVGASLRASGKLVLGGGIQDELSVVADELSDQPIYRLAGWFNGTKWVTCLSGLLTNRILDGDRGPAAGDVGLVARGWPGGLDHYTELMQEQGLVGFISFDLDALSATVRRIHGYGTEIDMAATFELVNENIGEFLYKVASGSSDVKFDEKLVTVAVRVGNLGGEPKFQVPAQGEKHFWYEAHPMSFGYACARGYDQREARRRVYRTILSASNQDVVYRSDIGLTPIGDPNHATYERKLVSGVHEERQGADA
jgi:hypothetical protein